MLRHTEWYAGSAGDCSDEGRQGAVSETIKATVCRIRTCRGTNGCHLASGQVTSTNRRKGCESAEWVIGDQEPQAGLGLQRATVMVK